MGLATINTAEVETRFRMSLDAVTGSDWVSKVCTPAFPVDVESVKYSWLGMVPPVRKMTNGLLARRLRESNFTITNEEYEDTLEFKRKELERRNAEMFFMRIDELADRMNEHWSSLLSTLISDGTSAACYDSQYFFDDDHSEGSSGTQKNLLTATEVTALDISDADVPTPDEMAKAIMGVIVYMLKYKDDQGEPMNSNAKGFLVLCPPTDILSAAIEAISSKMLNTGSGSRDNILQSVFNVDVACDARSSETTVFHVFRTDGRMSPIIRQEEIVPEVGILGQGSDYWVEKKRGLFSLYARRAAGYGYWQYASHCTLS